MRAVYLAIAGYLIGFFGQQRVDFEAQLRELEAGRERESIARYLHDGYIQSLGAVTLRLESCRDMLAGNEIEDALCEIQEIQVEVTNEYDEVRDYVRSLAGLEGPGSKHPTAKSNTEFRVSASFSARGPLIEHVMQIMFEGIRNTRRHSRAGNASVKVDQTDTTIRITIDDDGVGLAGDPHPPWTIASRVAEFGGELTIKKEHGPGAHIEIALPSN
jgi:signal transduction histidine kinase